MPDGLPLAKTIIVTLCRQRWELLGSRTRSLLAGYCCPHRQGLGPNDSFQPCSMAPIISFRAFTTTLKWALLPTSTTS